jgi:3-deoxy-D-manno-octulosonate 8-phosphate phosphatase (KDO 8-P phosphatase)
LDVDGVLTDGSIILDNQGNEYKAFHVRDGHGIRMLQHAGVRVAIITGRYSAVVERRARELDIRDVYQKCKDKRGAMEELADKYSISLSQVAYVGDDIVDAAVMRSAGLPISVADGMEELRNSSAMVTERRGGKGAVREVCDMILKAKGLWDGILAEYFEV